MSSERVAQIFALRQNSHSFRRSLIVGASIGAGLAAQAVRHGGADFLLVGNVGRYRMMGAPSQASYLPLRDVNKLVLDFGAHEILPASDMPTFFGAGVADPALDVGELVEAVRDAGFDGICNYPTAAMMTGAYRAALEAAGVGYKREVELLREAKRAGLSTMAYASGPDDITDLLDVAPDLICMMFDVQFGLTASSSQHDCEIAACLLRSLIATVRRSLPKTLCLCGGAAITNPAQMVLLCDLMRADGYIGGSTIDQRPLEAFIEERVAAFKEVANARHRALHPSQQIRIPSKLVASSAPVRALYAQIARAAREDVDIALTGEEGTGKSYISAFVHGISARRRKSVVTVRCDKPDDAEIALELFGVAQGINGFLKGRIGLLPSVSGGTVVIENVENIPLDVQAALLQFMEERRVRPLGGLQSLPVDVRLIVTSCESLETLWERGALDHGLYLRLRPFGFHLPPLRERLEELPILANNMLAAASERLGGGRLALEHSALRRMQAHSWPGNLRLLRSVIETAAFRAENGRIRTADLDLQPEPQPAPRRGDERAQILDALWRHKFRKGETAHFLGISRKTLYNKMKRFNLIRQQGALHEA